MRRPPKSPTSRRSRPTFVALVTLISLALAGCGSGGGIGAANTMPPNASSKAMDKADECDDGDLKACTWVGIWFLVGGAGKDRRYEGRRFLAYACKGGNSAACKLVAALDKPSAKPTTRPAAAPSGRAGIAAGQTVGDNPPATPSEPAVPAAPAADAGDCERGLPAVATADDRETARRCDNGNLASCHQVGVWYLKGQGGKDRVSEGVRWLKHGCERGHEASCTLLEELKRRLQEMKDQGKI